MSMVIQTVSWLGFLDYWGIVEYVGILLRLCWGYLFILAWYIAGMWLLISFIWVIIPLYSLLYIFGWSDKLRLLNSIFIILNHLLLNAIISLLEFPYPWITCILIWLFNGGNHCLLIFLLPYFFALFPYLFILLIFLH